MSIKNPVSIIIADDHALFREGVSNYLLKFPKYKVRGHASNGEELISLATHIRPCIILTDINMPVMNGIRATSSLQKQLPEVKVLALSYLDNETAVVEMLLAGASGYLCKNIQPGELEKAIDTVMDNHLYFSDDTNKSLAQQIAKSKYTPPQFKQGVDLSNRECEIIQLVCEDKTSYSIGRTLNISSRTVERHLSNIYRKIGVNSAVGLVIYAIKHKIFILSENYIAEIN